MTTEKTLRRISPDLSQQQATSTDPKKCLSGNPMQRVHNQFANSKENFFCGTWGSTEGKWNISYSEDEFCYIIKGKAIITDQAGHSETVVQGDAFVIPAGFEGTWETIGEVEKFYSMYEE
jgi:uncharacterized cupin superfamily protein